MMGLPLYGVGWTLYQLQQKYGKTENFFKHSFTTRADPADLADFYGSEEFMEFFSIFRVVGYLMMRLATFDENGVVHNPYPLPDMLPGRMEISMKFRERMRAVENTDSDEAEDEDEEEEEVFEWFEKWERFHKILYCSDKTIWDMEQKFGFHLSEDGETCEVYHEGLKFDGPFPVRFMFQLHSYAVIYLTEKHINGPTFGELEE